MRRKCFKKWLALLVTLSMALSLFGGLTPSIQASETYTYKQVSTITNGKTYLVAANNGGSYLAMSSGESLSSSSYGYLLTEEVTVSGDTVTLSEADAAAVEWVLTGTDASFTMYSNDAGQYASLYINPSHTSYKYGIQLSDSGTAWSYSGEDSSVTYTAPSGEATYTDSAVLYYSSTNSGFRANTDLSKAAEIVLFERQESSGGEPSETYTYKQVSTITSGKTYLVAANNEGSYLAMNTGESSSSSSYGYLLAEEVTVSGDTVTLSEADAAAVEWVLTGTDASFTMYSSDAGQYASLYINPSHTSYKYGIQLSDSGTAWSYSEEDNAVTYTAPSGEATYIDSAVLYYSSTSSGFRANTDFSKAAEIVLFERQESSGGEPSDEYTYIGFSSDVHGSTDNLEDWLQTLTASFELQRVALCGDYSYSSSQSTYIADYNEAVTLVDQYTTDGGVFTVGNHEYQNNGTSTNLSDYAGSIRIGVGAEESNYIIYCFGASGWVNAIGEYPDEDIEELSEFLEGAPKDIPIFIIAHFPLHYISSRTITNADKVIDLLNEYPNTVFLWGHNHSQSSETHYGEILQAGDTLQYTSASSETINFTYACAGALYDASKSPYYGLLAAVSEDGSSVDFTYYSLSGEAVMSKPSGTTTLTVSFGEDESDCRLKSLSYSTDGVNYTSVPGFSSSDTEYSIELPYGTPDGLPISLQGVCHSPDAVISENSGAVLSLGQATAELTVEAVDGTLKTYSVNFTVKTSPGTVYTSANSFVDGGTYLISFVDSGTAYCLDADTLSVSSGTAAAATAEAVSANSITTDDESLVWRATASGGGWLLSPANGDFTAYSLYMGYNSVLYLASSGRAMVYGTDRSISYTSTSGNGVYYLAYSGGSFVNSSVGSAITIFSEEKLATGIQITEESAAVRIDRTVELSAILQPTDATSEVIWSSGDSSVATVADGFVTGISAGTVTITATANGFSDTCQVTVTDWPDDEANYLAFTSDTHYEDGEINNTELWLDDISELYHDLDYMGFCGDLGSTSSASVAEYWEFVQEVIDAVEERSDFLTNGGIYTTGNHEMYSGPTAGGNYAGVKDTNPTAMEFTQNGLAAKTEDYAIYCFGSSNTVTSSTVQEFTDDQILSLEEYLDTAPDDIPIIVMSHYPLHYDGTRMVTNSEEVIALLNEHPNVIFLWGHNHSDVGNVEDNYDTIFTAGDELTTLNEPSGTTDQMTINFTYAAAGCMSDSEYQASSASVIGKGIVIGIADTEDGKEVTLTYYNLNGEPFTVPGKNTSETIIVPKHLEAVSISAEFTQGTAVVYPSTSLDALKSELVVTVTYSDSSTAVLGSGDYTLSGALTPGASTVTVTYGALSDDFTVSVTPVTSLYITAEFTQGAAVIYPSTALDSLKSRLTVTVTYSDGSTSVLSGGDYTLSGTLAPGSSTVTVTYGTLTDEFTVSVTAIAATSIRAVFTQGTTAIYPRTSLSTLKNMLVVTATNNDGSTSVLGSGDYTLSGTLTPGASTVTVTYGTLTDEFTVGVTAIAATSIRAVFTQGTTVIYPSTPLSTLKNMLVVTVTNNDGSTSILGSGDYTLSGTLTPGSSTVTVTYGTLTDTFTVTVTEEPAADNYTVTVDTTGLGSTFTSLWIDGVEYTGDDLTVGSGSLSVTLKDGTATNAIVYTYNSTSETDTHKLYPTGMYVWLLGYENGSYTARRVSEFDNLLGYAGCSIRITGDKKGIRLISSLSSANKSALTGSGLAGYTLVEYGTAITWVSNLDKGYPLLIGATATVNGSQVAYVTSNYAYSRSAGVDAVYSSANGVVQFSNIVVNYSQSQYDYNIALRSYMILTDGSGNRIVIYGAVVERSIAYIAYQNMSTYKAATAAYEYVWQIIHASHYGTSQDAYYEKKS